ncbi:hypothetical protein [Roseofilum casamattae]|uniref:Uncharacterized protein n=1 Tax=Roseofilum casamattae BLCC-M143 TaxID=3022442 RepID=A0ABT7C0L3_9CYAN|nr:hypothetical protein [Roseofilum casamattae]MDJ1184221.1 hypothetical protein [Roseofilum casamattae BLCC-M143]
MVQSNPQLNPSAALVPTAANGRQNVTSLSVITNPSGDSITSAGETFELRVTIGNQGLQGAIIDLFIDDSSGQLKTWCPNPYERFALSSGSSSEVVFSFPIPVEAIPGYYTYLLVIDAPKHYPEETPIRHQATLQILPPIQAAVQSNDPTFVLTPASTAEKPTLAEAGKSVNLSVLVHNRSNRVDRFRLTCTDLPESWWEVHYPEGINELGLVIIPDNLALNPGAKGEIGLEFRFPLETDAGRYLPTLRLSGENDPDLVLLDMVYVEVLPRYDLRMDLRTLVGKVSRETGMYQVRLQNAGNTLRQLSISVREDQGRPICQYQLMPDGIALDRGELIAVDLDAKPGPWWRRPLIGQGKTIAFYVELVDDYELPLPSDRIEGTLLWQARPWWQLLLAILAGLGLLGLLIFAIWWAFFKPPAPPRIDEFSSAAPQYTAENDDFIYLNWEIRNPRQIESLKILGRSPNGNVTSTPVFYNLQRGLPETLQEFCSLTRRRLLCQNIRTDAREPGDYLFEMTVMPKRRGQSTIAATTNTVTIAPLPIPKIAEFRARLLDKNETENLSSNGTEVAVRPNSPANSALAIAPSGLELPRLVELSWQVTHPNGIAELSWLSRTPDGVVNIEEQRYNLRAGLPEEWREYCSFERQVLSCSGIPVIMTEFGDYIFELTVTPTDRIPAEPESVPADAIAVIEPEPAAITEFEPTSGSYEAANEEQIALNWAIANPSQISELALKGRSDTGLVAMPDRRFSFQQGLPEILASLCTVTIELRCRNVPTPIGEPGNYRFELGVVPKRGTGEVTETMETGTIAIAPRPVAPPPPPPPVPKILQLQPSQSRYSEEKGEEVLLSWEVEHGEQVQEIQLVGRDRDGIVVSPVRRYRLDSGIPDILQPYCSLAGRLVCQNVPASARRAGDYIFELSLVAKGNSTEVSDRQQTEVIQILPPVFPLAITEFTVNGEPAPLRVVVTLQPNQRPDPLELSWQVLGGPETKVELLPSPGTVPLTGTVRYPISPQPGREILTLSVIGKSGKQLQRTLAIETLVAPPPETPASSTPGNETGTGTGTAPTVGVPPEPNGVSPTDLPPQFD